MCVRFREIQIFRCTDVVWEYGVLEVKACVAAALPFYARFSEFSEFECEIDSFHGYN